MIPYDTVAPMREVRAERLEGDDRAEQGYAIRGRRYTTGRSAMAPELRQTPRGGVGRENVETFVEEER